MFGGQAARLSPVGLAEMVVMAGGMSAEFGNALSGVVNFVTRDGTRSYEGSVEVLSSEFSGCSQDDVRDMTRARYYIGGPIPLTSKIFFFFSGSVSTQRDYLVKRDDIIYDLQVTEAPSTWDNPDIRYDPTDPYRQWGADGRRIHPLDIFSGWLGYGFDIRWDGLANINFKISPTERLKLSWIRNHRLGVPYTFNWRFSMFWGLPEEMQQNAVLGTPRYDASDPGDIITGTGLCDFASEKNILTENHGRLAVIWTRQPAASIFYSLRASYFGYNRTMRVRRWVNEDGYVPRYRHLYPEHGPPLWEPSDPMTLVTLMPFGYEQGDETKRRYGYRFWTSAGLGYDGSDRYYSDQVDITRTIKADVTGQAGIHHQVKSGFSLKRLMLDQNDLQILWYNLPYRSTYVHRPWELGIYIQDKIEYPDLVLNLGIRYDASHAGNLPWWRDPRDPTTGAVILSRSIDISSITWQYPPGIIGEPFNPEMTPFRAGKIRSQLSPRIGISHPVTDKAVIYFNYGHFFQNPVYRNLYLEGTLLDAIPLIGNPTMENEHSVHYEFGIRNYLDETHVIGLTLWAKDTSNLVGSEKVPSFFRGIANPYSYTVFLNYDYALSRGFDISLFRCFSGIWSGRLNYSFLYAQSNRDDPWAGYRGEHTLMTSPKRPRVVGWDQPHRFTGQLDLQLAEGVGPQIAGLRLFEKISANILFKASAGRPFTPTTQKGQLEPHSGRRPWTYQCDMRLCRDFTMFGLECGLIVQVRNVFDHRNVVAVYSRTGKPDDPGPNTSSYSDNYDKSHFFGQPRLIDFGIRLHF